MVVKLALKRKNENIQIWSRYSLFKNTGCRLPASSSAALTHCGPGPCNTTAICKAFSQWEHSFHWKVCCHWLKLRKDCDCIRSLYIVIWSQMTWYCDMVLCQHCVQIMAWCLNQCWLIISEVLWHSPEGYFKISILDMSLTINNLWLQPHPPGTSELIDELLLQVSLMVENDLMSSWCHEIYNFLPIFTVLH